MVSENASERPRLPHGLVIALGALLAVLAALLLAAGWLLGTGSGARAAFAMLASMSGSPLRAEGVRGRLTGPLQIDRLIIDSAAQRVTLDGVKLDWRAVELASRRLHITSLRADKLVFEKKEEAIEEPARLPDSIDLPFALKVDRAELGGGDIRLGPAQSVGLGPLAFALDYDGARYLLDAERFGLRSGTQAGTFTGAFKGRATLATARPYALDAQLASSGDAIVGERTFGAAGNLGAHGSLEELVVSADLAVSDARIKGRATVRPFSQQPLGVTDLSAAAVDLSRFKPDLPTTRIDATLSVAPDGAGELALTNAEAGPYDQAGAPLTSLRIAFRQQAGRFDFDRIAAMLGSAGRAAGTVTGSGRYADGALTLDLAAREIDLRGLDRRMRPTRLSGRIGLRQAAGAQAFSLDLTEPLNRRTIGLVAQGALAGSRLTIDKADLSVGNGRMHIAGHADLEGSQGFSATGDIARFRLKDLGDFAKLPELLLNARFSVSGSRQPQLVADLDFGITDSRLEGHPLQGEGKATLRADSVDIARFILDAGANRLNVQGRLSQNEGQLSFALTAPRLDQLGPGFGGALEANGTARGSFTRPQISASWSGNAIRLGELARVDSLQGKAEVQVDRGAPLFFTAASAEATVKGLRAGPASKSQAAAQEIAALSAQIRFAPQPDAPLALSIDARGVRAGGLRADTVKVGATGTTARHEIELALAEPEQRWTLAADGGLHAVDQAPRWEGSIRRFDAAGLFSARLAAPAQLTASQEKIQLDGFRLDSPMARISVERFLRDGSGIVTRGSMERVQVGQLMRFGGGEPMLTTDLQLSGDWDLSLTDTPAGTIRIRRDGGDVTMRGGRPVTLGLRSLEASATVSGSELALQLRAQGEKLGLIDAAGKIGLAGGRIAPAADAPITAQINIDVPSLGWAGPLVSPTSIVEGRLQSAVAVAGTLAQPRLSGRISGSGLRFLSAETGIDLRHGVLESEFRESTLVLRSLRFPSSDGQLNLAGTVDFAGGEPQAALTVTAERFQLLDRSDRKARVSGESRIGWRAGRADIAGDFSVDSGSFDIGSTSMPRLSDDVVIVGQTQKKQDESGLPASIDVGISLGKGVALRGRGLDATLVGQIRLASQPGEPLRARGTLRIEQGTFSAYGRELKIEQGVLRFNGPVGNPSLDIIAMRRGQQVEAGVAVVGTALSPRISLVSEPAVPEAEKLSWLVLGHGLESTGQGELGALQSAAGALLSRGAAAGVQSQVASALGLDQLSVGTTQDSLQERIVTLGKQVSTRLFVSLERGLETASSVVHLRYTLSPKLTIEAEAGTRSALSLFYNISYD